MTLFWVIDGKPQRRGRNECPLAPRIHFHVASGRFHGWHRHNHQRGA